MNLCPQAQNTNPFELQPRLSPTEQIIQESIVEQTTSNEDINSSNNPFELAPRLEKIALIHEIPAQGARKTDTDNPFDLTTTTRNTAPVPTPAALKSSPPLEAGKTPLPSTTNEGTLLAVIVGLLLTMTISLLFFREVYTKIYRALFNDNLLSQLYREREAGNFGEYLVTYLVFFLCAGVCLALTLRQLQHEITSGFLWQILYCVTGVTVLFLSKHLLLAIIGYIFPIQRVTGRYSFMIMIFSIFLSLLLAVASTAFAYAPEGWHLTLLFGTGALILLTYIWRSIRGLFQTNHLLFGYPFHFLSYICAIEIGPALVLIKLLTTS